MQAALAERLSEMILQLPDQVRFPCACILLPCATAGSRTSQEATPRFRLLQVALLYFTVFLRTLRREWFGIDHLRLDKFLMLIRKFMHQLLRLLQAGGW